MTPRRRPRKRPKPTPAATRLSLALGEAESILSTTPDLYSSPGRTRAHYDPAWIRKIADASPVVQKIRRARLHILATLDVYLIEAGLPPLTPLRRRRGRPPRFPHPMPRREPRSSEDYNDPRIHREAHQVVFVIGCQRCYMREYVYFQNHPEDRPKGHHTAGVDEFGRPQSAKLYQPGWDPEKHPFKGESPEEFTDRLTAESLRVVR